MIKSFFLILFVIISFNALFGKNEALNWYFGDKSAITFKTPDGQPVVLRTSSLSTLEGCSSISDTNGNLLFYTDGVDVYNKNHQLINKTQKLSGHYSSSQSALILRKPKSNNIYYIFTTDAGEYVENIDTSRYNNRGLNYSIVDINLNNGLGEIIKYNTPVYIPSTERLSAVFHQNQTDIWIISHEWGSRNYISFLLTENGIGELIRSEGTISHSGEIDRYIGMIKASPTGEKVACTIQGVNFIELSEFDNLNGKLSNFIRVETANRKDNYGIEFSPNSKLLYISDYNQKTIHQFDISKYDSSNIKSSEFLVFKDSVSHSIGALQIAPNGKIYIALNQQKHLASIDFPNKRNDACGFVFNSIELLNESGVRSRHGLPNLNQSNYEFKAKIDYKNPCQGDPLILKSVVNSELSSISYQWILPSGIITYEKDLILPNASPKHNGKYFLKLEYNDFIAYDSVYVEVIEVPRNEILGDSLLCVNQNASLQANIINDTLSYLWSTGERKANITISEPGMYSLTTFFPNGCIFIDTIIVKGLITNAGFTNSSAGLFNNVNIEFYKNIVFNFENNDSKELIINNVYLEKNSKEIHIKNLDNLKGILLPNSSQIIELIVFSKLPEIIDDSLVIEVSSPYCSLLFKAPVAGLIVVPMKISIPVINSEPSKKIDIPIIAKINTITNSKFKLNFVSEIEFNADYFYPDSCKNCKFESNYINEKFRKVRIIGNESDLSKDLSLLFSFSGTVLVGGDSASPIKISTVIWDDSLFINEYSNGELNISGCSIPLRPIKLFNPTSISLYPNPSFDFNVNIQVESTERGLFTLYLLNSAGSLSEITSWIRNQNDSDKKLLQVDLNKFSSGNYYILLKAPWSISIEKVILSR